MLLLFIFLFNYMFCPQFFVYTFKVQLIPGCYKEKEEGHVADCGFKKLFSGGHAPWLECKAKKKGISNRENSMNKDLKSNIAW